MKRTPVAVTAALLVLAPALAACSTESTAQPEGSDDRTFAVDASDDACEVSGAEAPAGTLTFEVSNSGSKVNEFYVLGEDGLRIVGEVENIGPGTSNTLTVNAPAGSYFTACKPGMKGQGIRDAFTVTQSDDAPSVAPDDQQQTDQAVTNYVAYVQDQAGQLLSKTKAFTTAYTGGDDARAKAIYPDARTHWERIETVAESFGDLDPKMDLREADVAAGQRWTGWHRMEKDLWPPRGYRALSAPQRKAFATNLMANTRKLYTRVSAPDYTVSLDQIANGSRGLLEEVATSKVSGEEETWSHTDLYDFQANVDGARVGYEGLQAIVKENDPELATTLDQRFAALQKLLDAQRQGDGFALYTELTRAEVKRLSDAVNALSEPLSQLTAAVVPS